MSPKYLIITLQDSLSFPGDCRISIPHSMKDVDVVWKRNGLQIIPHEPKVILRRGSEVLQERFFPWETFNSPPGSLDLFYSEKRFAVIRVEKTLDADRWDDFKGNIRNQGERFMAERNDLTQRLLESISHDSESAFRLWINEKKNLEKLLMDRWISQEEYVKISQEWEPLAYRAALAVISSEFQEARTKEAALSYLRERLER